VAGSDLCRCWFGIVYSIVGTAGCEILTVYIDCSDTLVRVKVVQLNEFKLAVV